MFLNAVFVEKIVFWIDVEFWETLSPVRSWFIIYSSLGCLINNVPEDYFICNKSNILINIKFLLKNNF